MNDEFNERFTLGEIAVRALIEIVEDKNIPYLASKKYFDRGWTSKLDKLWGDIVLYPTTSREVWIDVKYNSISAESLREFKGDYFWIFRYKTFATHSELFDHITLTRSEVLNMVLKNQINESELRSGSLGYKFVHRNRFLPLHHDIIVASKEHQNNILL